MSECGCVPTCALSDADSIDGVVAALLDVYGARLAPEIVIVRDPPPNYMTGTVGFISSTGVVYRLSVTGRSYVEIVRSATTMAAEFFRRGDWI